MDSLRVRTKASNTSFTSMASGSSDYFTPVSGLILHDTFIPIDPKSLTSRVTHQDTEVVCKVIRKKGFLRRLSLVGAKLCGKSERRNRDEEKHAVHAVDEKVRPTSVTVIATSTSSAEREVDEAGVQEIDCNVEGVGEKRECEGGRCRMFGLGASRHQEEMESCGGKVEVAAQDVAEDVMSIEKLKGMSGLWEIDRLLSDTGEEMYEIMELGWILRKALDNLDLLQIDINEERIQQVAKLFRLVDIAEEFPLSGEERTFRRRDLRKGPLNAATQITKSGYQTKLWWDEPMKGGMTETFKFGPNGQHLTVDAYVWRENGQSCQFKTFWRRKT